MKRTDLFLLLCLLPGLLTLFPSPAHSQLWDTPDPLRSIVSKSGIQAGLGWTRIAVNDSGAAINYATVTLNPEFAIGKLHTGLAIDLLVNTKDDPGGSQVRQTDLKLGRIIRYLRYGEYNDPWFLHIGALERITFGHGFILSRYSNQITDQSRRVGAWLKLDRGRGGIEAFISNLGTREIYGARAFLRPFYGRADRPVIDRLLIGTTVIIDDSPGRGRTRFPARSAEMVGLDIELPLIKKTRFSLISYGDFAKILDRGSGVTVGIRLELPEVVRLLQVNARIEQQYLGSEFIPAFFDERYEVVSVIASGLTRSDQLIGLPGSAGVLGALQATVLRRLFVAVSYRSYYKRDDSGVFHVEAHLRRILPRVTLQAVYDKINLKGISDIRTLDDRSVALAKMLYQVNSFISVGLNYRWTYVFDSTPDVQTYRPIERFTPTIQFAYYF